MAIAVYTVKGMTCGHCVGAVTTEIGGIAGVRDVAVDLANAEVTVTSDQTLDEGQVAAAVDEAGYVLVPAGASTIVDNREHEPDGAPCAIG